jgi:hypothetical protein
MSSEDPKTIQAKTTHSDEFPDASVAVNRLLVLILAFVILISVAWFVNHSGEEDSATTPGTPKTLPPGVKMPLNQGDPLWKPKE